jgi:parallel beta-helix repeat protein
MVFVGLFQMLLQKVNSSSLSRQLVTVYTQSGINTVIGSDSTINIALDVTLTSSIDINSLTGVVINGHGHTLDGASTTNIFSISNGAEVSINSLVITRGDGRQSNGFGGCASIHLSTAEFSDCTFSHCVAYGGGAVYMSSSTASFINCIITSSTSVYFEGGGLTAENSFSTFVNCDFTFNTALSGGGVFLFGTTATFTGCTIASNTVSFDGGGVSVSNSGTISFSGCTITGNKAGTTYMGYPSSGDGGGLAITGGCILTDCVISLNSATYGGGLSLSIGTLTRCTVSSNSATVEGGGLTVASNTVALSLVECSFSSNTAPSGGGIMGGLIDVIGCIFSDNRADSAGGDIDVSFGFARVYSLCSDNYFASGTGTLDCNGCSGAADLSDASACTACSGGAPFSCCGATSCSVSQPTCTSSTSTCVSVSVRFRPMETSRVRILILFFSFSRS